MGSLYSYCDIILITKLVYPPELQDFVLILLKIFWGRTPRSPFQSELFRLYNNHNTSYHLKKLKTRTQSPHFSGKLKIKWLFLYVLFEKSIVDHFFENGCLKEQKKSLKTP